MNNVNRTMTRKNKLNLEKSRAPTILNDFNVAQLAHLNSNLIDSVRSEELEFNNNSFHDEPNTIKTILEKENDVKYETRRETNEEDDEDENYGNNELRRSKSYNKLQDFFVYSNSIKKYDFNENSIFIH
jgi:hypothetical protein